MPTQSCYSHTKWSETEAHILRIVAMFNKTVILLPLKRLLWKLGPHLWLLATFLSFNSFNACLVLYNCNKMVIKLNESAISLQLNWIKLAVICNLIVTIQKLTGEFKICYLHALKFTLLTFRVQPEYQRFKWEIQKFLHRNLRTWWVARWVALFGEN